MPKNEMFHEDMIDIVVPMQQVTRELPVPGQEPIHMADQNYWITILGGDLLSAVRVRGAQRIRNNSPTSEAKLNGILPVAEDWHCKLYFMEVHILLIKIFLFNIYATYANSLYRLFRRDCIRQHRLLSEEHCLI